MTKEEALARRLCTAAGDDPDAQVLIVKELPKTRLGFLVLPKDLHMNAFDGWQFYRNAARAALVFLGHSPEAIWPEAPDVRIDRPRGPDVQVNFSGPGSTLPGNSKPWD